MGSTDHRTTHYFTIAKDTLQPDSSILLVVFRLNVEAKAIKERRSSLGGVLVYFLLSYFFMISNVEIDSRIYNFKNLPGYFEIFSYCFYLLEER